MMSSVKFRHKNMACNVISLFGMGFYFAMSIHLFWHFKPMQVSTGMTRFDIGELFPYMPLPVYLLCVVYN